MKALTCEMCGSQDLVRQDGLYVCQMCGTKYSAEDAKRMMIDGTVDVQGTVKIDNSALVEKYLANARRSFEKTDWEAVEKYYDMVEQNDPKNIEAVFYSAYGKAMLSLTESPDRFKRQQRFDVFCKSESVIDDYYDVEKSAELKPIIQGMSGALTKMHSYNFVFNTQTVNGKTTNDADYTRVMFAQAEIQFIESIEKIVAKDEQAYLYAILLAHYVRCINDTHVNGKTTKAYQEKMRTANARMKELDPTFTEVKVPSSGGCYVATAVYGSYDCPQVWTLRRYRDDTLAATWYGRAFIHTYYAVSPTLVKRFGETAWFKKLWQNKLDRMVADLNTKGVQNTPYEDKPW